MHRIAGLCAVLAAALCLVAPQHAVRAGAATAATGFADSFDGARDADPQYGLNDALLDRQPGAARGITYTRVPGLAHAGDDSADPLRPWHSQVNHPQYPGVLSMHLRTSAVRLDAPTVNDGTLTVAATMTPVVGSHTRGEWASLVLGGSAASTGYVTAGDSIGLLITASGKLQVFGYGQLVLSRQLATVPANGSYRVSWHLNGTALSVSVGGQVLTARVARAMPTRPWLFLGRYSADRSPVTTFDALSVSGLDRTGLQGGPVNTNPNLRYFGYFGARIEGVPGNHLTDVHGFSDMNWVSITDTDGLKPAELANCRPNGCILNTRWQFFTDCPGARCRLRSDAQQQWNSLVTAITPYVDRIGTFAVMDEAYYQGASYPDVAASAAMIKKSFPHKKVMLNFAAPSVTATAPIPPAVDWVAFDQYCQPMSTVENTLRTLEQATAKRPDVELFVYTESARTLCGTTKSDATIAGLQWAYYQLALRHPRVAGLFPFGLWTSETTLSALPLTIDAQQRLAARIHR